MQFLELFKVDLEVFLPPNPILMILSHLKWVLDRRERFNWQLVDEVALLEVLFEV